MSKLQVSERRVYKFPLRIPETEIELPKDLAVVRHVSWEGEWPVLWIECSADEDIPDTETRKFVTRSTGQKYDHGAYVGTVVNGPYMFHIFEVKP